MNEAFIKYKGTQKNTKNNFFTIKMNVFDSFISLPKFTIIDKRSQEYEKYELASDGNHWGIVHLKTSIWNIVPNSNKNWRFFPQLDKFFCLEGTELQELGETFMIDLAKEVIEKTKLELGPYKYLLKN